MLYPVELRDQIFKSGGECEIRTHGPVTADGFQDRCIKPLYQLPIIGADERTRTLNLSITSELHH